MKVGENMEAIDKEKEIKKQLKKLRDIYKDSLETRAFIVDNILQQLAFCIVTLNEAKQNVIENGSVSLFKQGSQEFMRESPAIAVFNKTIKTYQSLLKQLEELTSISTKVEDDPLIAFSKGLK